MADLYGTRAHAVIPLSVSYTVQNGSLIYKVNYVYPVEFHPDPSEPLDPPEPYMNTLEEFTNPLIAHHYLLIQENVDLVAEAMREKKTAVFKMFIEARNETFMVLQIQPESFNYRGPFCDLLLNNEDVFFIHPEFGIHQVYPQIPE